MVICVTASVCPSNEGVWCFHSALPRGSVPPFAALPRPDSLRAAFHSPSTAVRGLFEPKLQSLQRPLEVRTSPPPFPAPPRIYFHTLHFFPQFIRAKHGAQIPPSAPSVAEPNPTPRIPCFLTAPVPAGLRVLAGGCNVLFCSCLSWAPSSSPLWGRGVPGVGELQTHARGFYFCPCIPQQNPFAAQSLQGERDTSEAAR